MTNPVIEAVSRYPSRAEFARVIGVSAEAVRKWEERWERERKIPIERAIQIHRLTDGDVSVFELCPYLPSDIFGPSKPKIAA